MSSRKSVPHVSEASRRIFALREALKLSQEEFAARMGVGRIAALYWESGRSQPSADTYVRMAKVAKEVDMPSAVWFWQQVGVDRDALKDLLPEFNKLATEAEQRVLEATMHAAGGIVALPLVRTIAGIKEPTLASEDQIEAWLPLPAVLVPNPTKTSCLRAPRTMRSLGASGKDLLVVDSSDVPIERLWGKMVIAENQERGESYVGLMESFDIDNRRIPALRPAHMIIGVPSAAESGDPTKDAREQRESGKEISPMALLKPGRLLPMSTTTEWKILGRTICRIGCEEGGDLDRLAKGYGRQLEFPTTGDKWNSG